MSIKSKIILNGMKKELPTVKIFEPFQPEVIECESKEDFSEILNADLEKYNAMTTQKLNKIFHIPGYKITKIQNVICLRSLKKCEMLNSSKHEDNSHIQEEIKNIKVAFNQLSEQLETLKGIILGSNSYEVH